MTDLSEFYSASARVMSRSLIRELLKLTRRGGIISFAGGLPDPSTFPVEELKVMTTRVLEREPQLVLQYGPTEGDARLRDELVRWMAKDGIQATRDQILITTGSQQGLDLVGRVFLDPGDVILVERPSYMAALQVFRMYRVEMVGVTRTTTACAWMRWRTPWPRWGAPASGRRSPTLCRIFRTRPV
jgi:2-aminoadipate transaminase